MKKVYVSAALIAASLAMTQGAKALDSQSVASDTTMGLYKSNPYDVTVDQAKLYQIDRWRLFTNLSALEGGESYLLGTSGKLGAAGSIGVFYETNKYEYNDFYNDIFNRTQQYADGTTIAGANPYDGVADDLYVDANPENYWSETKGQSIKLAYSKDLGIASIGLSIDPTTSEYNSGSSNAYVESSTEYGDVAHSKFRQFDLEDSNAADYSRDEDGMGVTLGSHLRLTDAFNMRLYLGYVTEESDVDQSQRFVNTSSDTHTGTSAVTDQYFGGLVDGYFNKTSDVITYAGASDPAASGALSSDIDGFNMEVRPELKINTNVMLRCDVAYHNYTGDVDGAYASNRVELDQNRLSAADPINITLDRTTTRSAVASGDYDETGFAVKPRVYFTYGPSQFALGIGYSDVTEETEGNLYGDVQTTVDKFYDADIYGAGTGAYTGKRVTIQKFNSSAFSREFNTETWVFPVAASVKLNDKWTFRAGAQYNRVNYEDKYFRAYASTGQGSTTDYDANDVADPTVQTTDNGYFDTAGNWVPVDTEVTTTTDITRYEGTDEWTDYRLGLGYQMTENVNLDMEYKGSAGVLNASAIYASVVFAF